MASFWKFRQYVFLWTARFWKFQVYKFFANQQCKKEQKRSLIKGHSANVFAKISGKTGRSLWKTYWNLKKAELTYIFCAYYCIYFREIWILCILGVCLFLRILFKENFAKLTKVCEICENIYTQRLVRSPTSSPKD